MDEAMVNTRASVLDEQPLGPQQSLNINHQQKFFWVRIRLILVFIRIINEVGYQYSNLTELLPHYNPVYR